MTLTVHHLNRSQSERIVWLCEELGIEYDLQVYPRDPQTGLAPAALKEIHPAGTAPTITDVASDGSKVVLAESAAIVEWIIHKHGGGRLAVKPSDSNYADYLAFFHFANGTLQNAMGRNMMLRRLGDAVKGAPFAEFVQKKATSSFEQINTQLGKTGAFLAGPELTAADIMNFFTLTTMRGFYPADLSPYSNILKYFERVGNRPAYQKAMKKGDPELTPMLGATVTPF